MASRALGLIEVRGYLGAIVAADAAVKAANVSLLNIETVKSGLNTVQLIGDVSAVKSAVDSAVDIVKGESYYIASHVIPRLDEQTNILLKKEKRQENEEVPKVVEENLAEVESITKVVISEGNDSQKYQVEELQSLKVVELRSIAYREENIGLTKKEIKFANKAQLIKALSALVRKE